MDLLSKGCIATLSHGTLAAAGLPAYLGKVLLRGQLASHPIVTDDQGGRVPAEADERPAGKVKFSFVGSGISVSDGKNKGMSFRTRKGEKSSRSDIS